jgi:hypothetical protein
MCSSLSASILSDGYKQAKACSIFRLFPVHYPSKQIISLLTLPLLCYCRCYQNLNRPCFGQRYQETQHYRPSGRGLPRKGTLNQQVMASVVIAPSHYAPDNEKYRSKTNNQFIVPCISKEDIIHPQNSRSNFGLNVSCFTSQA